jgi:glycosyltransferase involved in cell wall biosynthesis
MICFLRCATVNEDVRLRKYIQACESRDLSFFALTWNRLNVPYKEAYEIQFDRNAPYGLRWKNLWNKVLWQIYILKYLIKKRCDYTVIHATNFENILPALLMKFFLNKKVVYDIYDSFSSDLSDNFLTRFLIKLEVFCIRKSDLLILADKKRLQQISITETTCKQFLDIENVPNFKQSVYTKNTLDFNKIKLSYVGVFDPMRGLEELLNFVEKNDSFILEIAGGGTLNNIVKYKSDTTSRIIYHGVVKYEDGINIMQKSDFIIGMYYKQASNHVYAAPNKFFESLYLARPLITTQGTLVGEKTNFHETGYAIEEGYDEITNFFTGFIQNKDKSLRSYKRKIENAANLWNSEYANYFEKRLVQDYINIILSLNDK